MLQLPQAYLLYGELVQPKLLRQGHMLLDGPTLLL